MKDNCCPYCGAVIIQPKIVINLDDKRSEIELSKIDQEMVFINVNGEEIEVRKDEAMVYCRVKKYGKQYTKCQNLAELKAFRNLKGYANGWLWFQQKRLNIWR